MAAEYSILITDPMEQVCIDMLRSEGFYVEHKPDISHDELIKEVPAYHVLIVRSRTQVTQDIIESGKRLKIIGRAGTGVDNIDINAATRCGVIVMNVPGGNTVSTAEHTVSVMLALARDIPRAWKSLRNGEWDRSKFRGVELHGKTAGVIGAGKVGREVGIRLKGFGMKIIAFDPLVSSDLLSKIDFEPVSFEELLRRSDFITIHSPLNDHTKGLINADNLKKCKTGVRIINCARGGIIEEKALFEGLENGKVAGAALDVFEKEPPGENSLIKHPRVVATPHLGAATTEAQEKIAVQIGKQIADTLKERSLVGSVNVNAARFSVRAEHRPYLELAERLGQIAGQLMEGKLKSVTFITAGESLHSSFDILLSASVKGILSNRLSEPVNEISSLFFARELGIGINQRKDDSVDNYLTLLTLEFETDREKRSVSGTVFGANAMRLVGVDGFRVEIFPEGNLLLYWNIDRPGMLASVGSVLASADINIAGLSLGRTAIGEKALTIVAVDHEVPESVLTEISKISGVMKPKVVKVGSI